MDEVGVTDVGRGDDRAHLEAAYDRYAAGLYDYCRWLSGDRETAEDAVHGALLAALGRDGRLATKKTLRAWLFGVARNECIRAARRAETAQASWTASGLDTAEDGDQPEPQLANVRSAAASRLNRYEQEVAELALRHRLSPNEVANVLGRRLRCVRTTIMRVHATLTAACGNDVLLTFAAPPAGPLPESLYERVVTSAEIRARVEYFTERAEPFTRAGFPVPLDEPRFTRAARTAAVVAIPAAVVLGLAGVVIATGPASDLVRADRQGPIVLDTPTPERSEVPSLWLPPEPTPSVTPSGPSPSPSRAVDRAGTGLDPTVRLSFQQTEGCPRTWTAPVVIAVDGNVASEAQLTWWTDTNQPHHQTAVRTDDDTFQATIAGLEYGVETFFQATVKTVDEHTGVSGIYPVTARCR